MRRFAALAAILLTAAASDPVVAVRGSEEITASQVRVLIANEDAQTRAKLAKDPAALQSLIRNEMLRRAVLTEAHTTNWDRKPDVVAMLARTRDAAIVQGFLASRAAPPNGYPTEADIKAAYDQAKPQLMQPRAYHLTQVFIPLSASATPAEIQGAKTTLAAQRDIFAASHDPKYPPGVQTADLGWVAENRLQPAAKDAVAGLLEGQISAPVCSPTGCALLKLVATRPAGPAPLADVRDGLVRLLRQQKERQGEQAYANTLLAREPVRVDEIQLSHVDTH